MSPDKKDTASKNDYSDKSVKADDQKDKSVVAKPVDGQQAGATQDARPNQNKFDTQDRTEKKQDVKSPHHSEKQNVEVKEHMQKDKKNLNGSPQEQRV